MGQSVSSTAAVVNDRTNPVVEAAEELEEDDVNTTPLEHWMRPVKVLVQALRRTSNVQMDFCQFGHPDLQLTKVLTVDAKDSASDTVISFGQIRDVEVAIKLAFADTATESEGTMSALHFERAFYEKVVPQLLRHTPHLISYIGTYECRDFQRSIQALPNNADIRIELQKLQVELQGNDDFDLQHAFFLMTEKSRGKPLNTYFFTDKKKRTSDFEGWTAVEQGVFMRDILLQVAYTLLVFERFGVMHNDLHDGNVFVERLPEPVQVQYSLTPTITVRVTLHYLVKLYDFDHAAYPPLAKNLLLDLHLCASMGDCDEFQRHKDWFTFLSFLSEEPTLSSQWQREIGTIMGPAATRLAKTRLADDKRTTNNIDRLSFMGHPCLCVDRGCDTCIKATSILETMPTLMDFITRRYPQSGRSSGSSSIGSAAAGGGERRIRRSKNLKVSFGDHFYLFGGSDTLLM